MTIRAAVLVIDDEPGIRDMLMYELSQEGFDVETAENGLAAVEAVKRRKFDLAVTDLKMPGMDGVQTLEALRALDPDIEVIVATGYASVETAVACMKRGAYDYIQKPYDPAELTLLLERASQKNHLQSVVALYEASRALLATLKHSDLVRLVVTQAQRVLRADDIGLLLNRADSKDFDIHRMTEASLPSAELLTELARRVSASGTALRLPSPMMPMVTSSREGDSYAFALVYPLVARDRHLGALVALRRSHSQEFSVSELQRGTVFASQLAVSLDNARLYDELAQKISELMATREQLVHTEKLALAGKLAGAVAHEVNNPLAYVWANLDALRNYSTVMGDLWLSAKGAAQYLRSLGTPEAQVHALGLAGEGQDASRKDRLVQEIAEVIDETLDGVKRIAELVAGFSNLASSREAAFPEQVDVNDVLRECVEALPGQERQHLRQLSIEAQPCTALLSREDLRSALLNLLAFLCAPDRQRTQSQGALRVRTTWEGTQPAVIFQDETLTLTEAERHGIFDPRVELDREGRTMRLNLALALSYQVLRRGGAEVSTAQEPGQGLTLRVLLPPVGGK
ncbi:response regulator [Hyalangium versicolor]|uniref:response regulator n=1 Tax=Hyalangium versicolor TaxID=2861190 RepID=UPI001CCB8D4A|nr:response regulator [Hyalangium versicolor]